MPLRNMVNWFFRSWAMYLLIVVAVAVVVNKDKTKLNHLNYLKSVEGYLSGIENGTKPFDELRIKDGVHYFRELKGVMPHNSYLLGNLGFCYFYLDDFKKAVGYYTQAIEREPTFYAFHYDLGAIYLKQDEWKKGVAQLNEALTLIPQAERYYLQAAKSFLNSGKKEISAYHLSLAKRAREDRQELLRYFSLYQQKLLESPPKTSEGIDEALKESFTGIIEGNPRLHFNRIIDYRKLF